MKVQSENQKQWLEAVSALYDSKMNDLNLELASSGLIHHHNGIIFKDRLSKRVLTQKKLMSVIHESETKVTQAGVDLFGKIKRGARILDAGCGRGGTSLYLAQNYDVAVTGINLSEYQLSICQALKHAQKLRGQVEFKYDNMMKTQFEENQFDHIWCCEASEHAFDIPKLLKEFSRIAKKNAKLVLIAWVATENHPRVHQFLKLIDRDYCTRVHGKNEYLNFSSTGWIMRRMVDWTTETTNYWKLRSRLKNKTGRESYMEEAFLTGAVQYLAFQYDSCK